MTHTPNSPQRGIRVTTSRAITFVIVVMLVLNLAFDAFSPAGVTWWTLFKVVVASGIVIGAGFAWLRARARRRSDGS
jgi:hypothetical protein